MAYWRNTGGSLASGNWIDDSGSTGIPSAGDDVEFGPAMASAVTGGLTDLAAIHLANVFFKPGHYAVASSTHYAQLYCDSIDDSGGGSAASYIMVMNPVTACKISMSNGPTSSGTLTLGGKLDLTRGVANGNMSINRDPDFGTYGLATTVSANAVVLAQAGVSVGANVTLNGGTIRNGGTLVSLSNIGDWTIIAGSLTTDGAATFGTVVNTGTFNHGSTGNGTTLENRSPGVMNRSANKYTPWTLGTLKMEGNTSVDLGTRVTLTNPIQMLSPGYGPSLPTGSTMTISLP